MFETAFFGSKFATAVLVSSIILGLLVGFLANILEKKTNFFKDQFRLVSGKSESCCGTKENTERSNNCCGEGVKADSDNCCSSKKKVVIK